MHQEPSEKNAIVFFDGQSVFHSARLAFGYTYPNYDVLALSIAVCAHEGWRLAETRFYTGIPDPGIDPSQHAFWSAKLTIMGYQGVKIVTRPLYYRREWVRRPDGTMRKFRVRKEKGIDVKIALDLVYGAQQQQYDVAVIFSQDQTLAEAIDLVRSIAKEQNRWIRIASAFPDSETSGFRRGIDKTDWLPINAEVYGQCLDLRDYRSKEKRETLLGVSGGSTSLVRERVETHPKTSRTKETTEGLKLFVSYSHRDERLRDELRNHLSLLMREGTISEWYDRKIGLGKDIDTEIRRELNEADIVLLLVSSDFLSSDYCYDREVKRAMERHAAQECRVVPIILRHCDWESAPFGKLLAAPKDGMPVTDRSAWRDDDEALHDVAKRIRSLTEEILDL